MSDCHYISNKLNVAENCVRPIKFSDFHNNCRYLSGQEFLHLSDIQSFTDP